MNKIERAKDFEKLEIGEHIILAEVIDLNAPSIIKLSGNAKEQAVESVAKIVKVGEMVNGPKIGDIILGISSPPVFGFEYKGKTYAGHRAGTIDLRTSGDNYDLIAK